MRRLLPVLIAFVLTVAALVPSALSLPQHGDEKMYAWKAGYYGGMLARLDMRPVGAHLWTDPAWSPAPFWAYEQPLGSHWVYALALAVTGAAPPAQPYSYVDAAYQGADTTIPDATLPIVRLTAILAAAVGLALIVYRFRWPSLGAVALFLLIPHVREDLSRAWAEGPLLLGFGLCALAYGSRWFGVALGLAASFKLGAPHYCGARPPRFVAWRSSCL